MGSILEPAEQAMSSVSPISATAFPAGQRDPQPSKVASASHPPRATHETASSTRVTLGHEPSPDYTDRIQRRARVNVEAVLAGSGHAFHAAGMGNALPGASVAASQLTYSFSPQVGAGSALDGEAGSASNEQQQAAMRAMVYLSSMMRVRFVEVAMGGQISFGGGVLPTGGSGDGGGGGNAAAASADDPGAAVADVSGSESPAPAPAPAYAPASRPGVSAGTGLA